MIQRFDTLLGLVFSHDFPSPTLICFVITGLVLEADSFTGILFDDLDDLEE